MEEEKQITELKEETKLKNQEVRRLAEENQLNITRLRELLNEADEENFIFADFWQGHFIFKFVFSFFSFYFLGFLTSDLSSRFAESCQNRKRPDYSGTA